jgi:predicted transcriptional regulator
MMKNITLAVDEDVLKAVRRYAATRDTTVNAMVREYLADIVQQEDRLAEAKRGLKELMDNPTGRLGPNYEWNREELYEERLFPRHQRPDLRRDGEGR